MAQLKYFIKNQRKIHGLTQVALAGKADPEQFDLLITDMTMAPPLKSDKAPTFSLKIGT
jgi:hypothetical protein